jgi:hypothetical protein
MGQEFSDPQDDRGNDTGPDLKVRAMLALLPDLTFEIYFSSENRINGWHQGRVNLLTI